MIRKAIALGLLCCLLLALSACGNKGPLVQADDEERQKKEAVAE